MLTTEYAVSTAVYRRRPISRTHLFLAAACLGLLGICVIGPHFTDVPDRADLLVLAVLLVPSLVPALILHDQKKWAHRDAALTLPWVVALVFLIPFPTIFAARLHVPLRDSMLARMDTAMGFSVPAIMAWVSHHPWLNELLRHSYSWLFGIMPLAVILPIVAGRKEAAERFALSNAIAFLIALPIFALLPAVGPWVGFHFQPSHGQALCEQSIRALHSMANIATLDAGSTVTFPSFHVIWAVLSAAALWPFRPLRIPVAIVASLIICSTVATGWHYVVDVLGGILLAWAALWMAQRMLYPTKQ